MLRTNKLKNLIIISLLFTFLFIGCNNNYVPTPIKEDTLVGPINWELKWKTDCIEAEPSEKKKDALCSCMDVFAFLDTYLWAFPCPKVYFIKGVAQKFVYKYGLKIKLIEDIKGNFPQYTGTMFTAFGGNCGGDFFPSPRNRLDYFTWLYKEYDTLLMLLVPAIDWLAIAGVTNEELITDGIQPFYEKEGDYTTISCAISTIKLENCNIIGDILKFSNGERPDTISYKYFQKKLKEIK